MAINIKFSFDTSLVFIAQITAVVTEILLKNMWQLRLVFTVEVAGN